MAAEPLVSGEWLARHMAGAGDSPAGDSGAGAGDSGAGAADSGAGAGESGRLRIVHVSTDREAYDRAHIPGAIFSDLHVDLAKGGTRPETGTARRDYILPARHEVAAVLRQWGITPGTRVVLYDDAGLNRHAARGYWLLRVYGFPDDRVHLLDGGLTAWQAEGRPTTTEPIAPVPTDTTEPLTDADPALLATADDVLEWSREATSTGDEHSPTRLLDVRQVDEFVGADVQARRGGRIPGAKHRLFSDFVGQDGRLRDRAQTLAILEGSGVEPCEVRATYCQGGIRAALAWFVLHEVAGLTEVRNYAASWEEWGNRPELPVER
jgi:thiosulfate/3-mercaptopyruvate sulfurtransferase